MTYAEAHRKQKQRESSQRYRERRRALNPPQPRVFKQRDPFDRFMEKVSIPEGSGGGCWTWTASLKSGGYGQILFSGRPRPAPRVAMAIFRDFDVDSPLHVLHRCDNRLCVNPDHLWLGTNADNMRDRNEKGRTCKGSDNPASRLTEANVIAVRARLAAGDQVASVARAYGVTRATIRDIREGRTWKHVQSGGGLCA